MLHSGSGIQNSQNQLRETAISILPTLLLCRNLQLNYTISLLANSRNFNSVYQHIFTNHLMIAYITKIQKSKFANLFPNLTILVQVFKLNSMNIFFPVGY